MRYLLSFMNEDNEYEEALYRSFDEAKEAEAELQAEGFETFGIEKL